MISKLVIIFTLLIFSQALYAQKTPYKTPLDSLLLEGIEKINIGEFEEAIKLLDEAIVLDSTKWEIHYEKALAYYQIKEFDSVIIILEPFQSRNDLTDNYYQILGSSYDIIKEYDKAQAVYDTALSKFPNSGKIYMEYGIHHIENEKSLAAVAYWQKGIEVEPDYEYNYYWLSKYQSYLAEYAWTIMYGEVFLNLSNSTYRLEDISYIINDSFTAAFYSPVDSINTTIKFTTINIISKNLREREDLPFEVAYQIVMREAADSISPTNLGLPKNKTELTIDKIYQIRKKFIEIWYNDKWNKRYSNPLFDLHKKMIKSGHFEAYNYWIFNASRKKESNNWLKDKQQKLEDFGNWMVKNSLKIHKGNYFTKSKYSDRY
ncbi:tetratricopeptide repeat protein [Bacteroidota bacterium]